MDRTKPPMNLPLEQRITPDGYEYMVPLAASAWGRTADEAVANAWTWYDRITLPARVALLRELAAEFDEPDSLLEGLVAEASGQDIAIVLRQRAAALEAKG